MADERILAGIRRFWTRPEVEAAYQAVFAAYADGAAKEVVITQTNSDGQGASGTLVLDRSGMVMWMDALEERLREWEEEAAGLPGLAGPGSPVTDFSRRRVGT